MADFETITAAAEDLVISALSIAILFAPISAPLLQTIEDATTGDLDTEGALAAYTGAGIIKKDDGVSITSDVESSDIEGYGAVEPVRTIITKRVTKWNANFIETNREVIEKYWGVNLDDTNLTVSPQGGVTVKTPVRPKNIFYRCLLIAEDEVNGEALYPYWIMPKVKLSEVDNNDLKDDDAIQYKMTFQAYKDPVGKFSVIQGWCGPGWRKLVDKTGFVSKPTAITATAESTSIAAAATTQITVMADNGINRTPDATYSSSAEATATVSATGEVTGVAAGSATITVTYQPVTGGAPLTSTVEITVTA